jgi:PEP-CTERM motif
MFVSRGGRDMRNLRRPFQPTIIRIVASAALACTGSIAFLSASQAAAVTFNYTGADVSYTTAPGAYRITVYGAQGGNACPSANCSGSGGHGAEASAVYKIGQTLNLRIGVGGAAPENGVAGGGGGASFVDFEIGDPGLDVLLLVGGGGGGSEGGGSGATGGNGGTTPTDPLANGMARVGAGGNGGGFSTNGQSNISGGEGGTSLLSGGAPGQFEAPGGFGGGGGAAISQIGGGGGGGFNGGDGGYSVFDGDHLTLFASQGGTSFANDHPDGCGPDGGPACFVGGLLLAVGAGGDGQGLGNGSVVIEPVSGTPVPEPSTWAMLLLGFAGLGFLSFRASTARTRPESQRAQ